MFVLCLLLCALVLPPAPLTDDAPVALGPFGGDVAWVSVDPAADDVMLMLLDAGGLWRSTDGGTSWSTWGGDLPASARLHARVPGSSTHLYAVAGDVLWGSVDGGAAWTPISSGWSDVDLLVLSPDPDVLLLHEGLELWRSQDGGVTSSLVVPFLPSSTFDAAWAPSDPSRVYLCYDGGLLRSEDGGLTFVVTQLTSNCRKLAVHPDDADRLLVWLASLGVDSWLLVSDDGGVSFVFSSMEPAQALHWEGGDTALMLSGDVTQSPELWRTTDGGTTWLLSEGELPNAQCNGLDLLGGDALVALGQADGGLFRGAVASPLPAIAPATGMVPSVALITDSDLAVIVSGGDVLRAVPGEAAAPFIPGGTENSHFVTVLASRHDDLYWVGGSLFSEGEVWRFAGPSGLLETSDLQYGDVGALLRSPFDGDRLLAVASASGSNLDLGITTDGGATWDDLPGIDMLGAGLLAFDPHTPGRVVAEDVNHRVWESLDDGATFADTGLVWPGFGGTNWLAFDPFTPGRMLRGLTFDVQQSLDDGQTWAATSFPGGVPRAVWFDPASAGVGLALRSGGMMRTDDGFVTATPIPVGDDMLSGAGFECLAVDADDGGVLIGTTVRGAWYLADVIPHQDLGGGTPGSGGWTPRHHAIGWPEVGTAWGLGVDRARGGAPGVLLVGVAEVSLPVFGGTFVIAPPIAIELPFIASGAAGVGGAGAFSIEAVLPPTPALVGLTLVSQAALADPGATSVPGVARVLSNGLRTTIR